MVYPQDDVSSDDAAEALTTKPAKAEAPRLPVARSGGERGRRTGPAAPALGAADDPLAIDHPTLGAVVAERLRQLITDGTLVPGVWLNERDLCERLRVSRTPLREAYRLLASDGLVMLLPKRGAQVIALSAEDVGNLFDVLAVMEGLAGRQAAERATDAELQQIAQLHRAMLDAYAARDIQRYFEASMGTHVAINAAAHNPVLTETYRRLNMRVQNLRYKSNVALGEWSAATSDHEDFVAALLARDGAKTEALLRQHVLEKRDFAVNEARARETSGD
ncbi:GntR family transcriptional regulator [Cupriavidus sp.]